MNDHYLSIDDTGGAMCSYIFRSLIIGCFCRRRYVTEN